MQAYSVVVTRSSEMKEKLFEPHFRQEMVREAPVLLTFCADFRRMRKWLEDSNAPANFDNFMSFMIGSIDAILASQNAALCAESEGLGICFLGTTLASCDRIAEILECPEFVVPVVGFVLGYPAEAPHARDRLPLAGLVHRERYRDPDALAVRRIYRERERAGFARYLRDPELRARTEAAGAKNLAQIYTRVKYTRESHVEYSREIRRCLERQGFFRFD
jgi:hypothetical protein